MTAARTTGGPVDDKPHRCSGASGEILQHLGFQWSYVKLLAIAAPVDMSSLAA